MAFKIKIKLFRSFKKKAGFNLLPRNLFWYVHEHGSLKFNCQRRCLNGIVEYVLYVKEIKADEESSIPGYCKVS